MTNTPSPMQYRPNDKHKPGCSGEGPPRGLIPARVLREFCRQLSRADYKKLLGSAA
ncbi:MAG: hypothetical protein WCI05_09480 [Myxococcales bacterium]